MSGSRKGVAGRGGRGAEDRPSGPDPGNRGTPDGDGPGLECRRCGCRHLYVVETRKRSGQIMRIRRCRHCGQRLITREKAG